MRAKRALYYHGTRSDLENETLRIEVNKRIWVQQQATLVLPTLWALPSGDFGLLENGLSGVGL